MASSSSDLNRPARATAHGWNSVSRYASATRSTSGAGLMSLAKVIVLGRVGGKTETSKSIVSPASMTMVLGASDHQEDVTGWS